MIDKFGPTSDQLETRDKKSTSLQQLITSLDQLMSRFN